MDHNYGLKKDYLSLRGLGSFFIGGRIAEVHGLPKSWIGNSKTDLYECDPNGLYWVEQMYVQYAFPKEKLCHYPIIFWHGGGMTGSVWESTPDERPGWKNIFLENGCDVYVVDGVERGRSGWAMYPQIWPTGPEFMTIDEPLRKDHWRIKGENENPEDYLNSNKNGSKIQFPLEAYDNFVKSFVPRWRHNDDASIKAVVDLLDRIGPCIILSHSHSCALSFAVMASRPENVKALIALEHSQILRLPEDTKLPGTPILSVIGDYVSKSKRRVKQVDKLLAFNKYIEGIGGEVWTLYLSDIGEKGNSHFPMCDYNSDKVARHVLNWLAKRGLFQSFEK